MMDDSLARRGLFGFITRFGVRRRFCRFGRRFDSGDTRSGGGRSTGFAAFRDAPDAVAGYSPRSWPRFALVLFSWNDCRPSLSTVLDRGEKKKTRAIPKSTISVFLHLRGRVFSSRPPAVGMGLVCCFRSARVWAGRPRLKRRV